MFMERYQQKIAGNKAYYCQQNLGTRFDAFASSCELEPPAPSLQYRGSRQEERERSEEKTSASTAATPHSISSGIPRREKLARYGLRRVISLDY
jgi:hypothetical protein